MLLNEQEYEYYLFEYQKWKREKIEKILSGEIKEIDYSVNNNLEEIQEKLNKKIPQIELEKFELQTENVENDLFVIEHGNLVPINNFFNYLKEEVLGNDEEFDDFIKYFKEFETEKTDEEIREEFLKNKFEELLVIKGDLQVVDYYEFPFINNKKYKINTIEKTIKGV